VAGTDGQRLSKKYLAQSWRVPGGISALGDRSTFMPARKNKRAGKTEMKAKTIKQLTQHRRPK
jgi:hypothetical protein